MFKKRWPEAPNKEEREAYGAPWIMTETDKFKCTQSVPHVEFPSSCHMDQLTYWQMCISVNATLDVRKATKDDYLCCKSVFKIKARHQTSDIYDQDRFMDFIPRKESVCIN